MRSLVTLLLLLVLLPSATADEDTRAADLAAARALFERNITAIQERDREAYLGCYLDDPALIRGGPEGALLGFADLATGTPASGSDDWPDELVARDLQLHWIGDGLVYGSYRFRVDLGGQIREGLSERVFRRTPAGWRIVVTTAFDAAEGTPAAPLALVGATLYDGQGGPPLQDAVLITRGGRIEALGPRAATPVPAGVELLDLAGRFIVPGLVDTHVHYSQTGWADGRPDARDVRAEYPYAAAMAELERHPERLHRAFLASGVTAVFDVGGYPWTRRLGQASELSSLAPHVAATGPLLVTWAPDQLRLPDQLQMVLMEDEAGVRAAVRAHAAAGSDAIKVWYVVRAPGDTEAFAPLVRAAGDEARQLGLPLVVHATQLETARIAVEAGASLLVHSVDDAPVDDAFVQAVLEADVSYCPTLTVMHGYGWLFAGQVPEALEQQLARVHPAIAERVRATRDLGPHSRFDAAGMDRRAERQAAQDAIMAANLMRLQRAGVRVVAGTDAGNPLTLHGPSMLPELLAMQAAGMAPGAVLVAATRDGAAAMGRGADLGLLAPGRVADLLVLERDPGEDVAHLGSLLFVMRAGTLQTPQAAAPR